MKYILNKFNHNVHTDIKNNLQFKIRADQEYYSIYYAY